MLSVAIALGSPTSPEHDLTGTVPGPEMARRARVDPYPRIVAEAAILVVDDDTPIRRMLERTLGAEGYEVRSAADGGGALAAIERFAPDVLVLDVAMPGVDGLGVCRRVRAGGWRCRSCY